MVLAGLCAVGGATAAGGNSGTDHGAWFAPTLRWEGGSVEVAFGMDEAARVSLVAYDAQGRALATLVDRPQPAGYHRMSVFSNDLQCREGRIFFRLRAGDDVLAELRPRSD
jgi:hypothetical protein